MYRCRLRSASPSDPPAVGDRPLVPFCGDGVRFDGNCIADCDSGSFVASACSGWVAGCPAAGSGCGPRPRAASRRCASVSTRSRAVAARCTAIGFVGLRRPLGAIAPPDRRSDGAACSAACGTGRSSARLHEHERRVFLGRLAASAARARRAAAAIVWKQTRNQENEDDRDEMHDDRDEDAFAPGDGSPDRRYIRPVILEIEIHQVLRVSISGGAWG